MDQYVKDHSIVDQSYTLVMNSIGISLNASGRSIISFSTAAYNLTMWCSSRFIWVREASADDCMTTDNSL